MTRNGITFLAATALTIGMATFVSAQDKPGSDCPEDMNAEPGCQLDEARQSDRGDPTPGGPADDAQGDGTSGTPAADPSGTAGPDGADAGGGTAPAGQEGQGDGSASGPDSGGADQPGGEAGGSADDAAEQSSAAPAGHGQFTAVREEGGRYYTAEDTPTFHIAEDGTVDWLTYSGFRRYHSECHVCHGPDGMGSSYAPALVETVQNMSYYDFYGIVVNGKQQVNASQNQVMPAFGTNQNVMCYLDDIYVYLLARGVGDLPRGRPAKKQAKSEMIQEAEDACMGA